MSPRRAGRSALQVLLERQQWCNSDLFEHRCVCSPQFSLCRLVWPGAGVNLGRARSRDGNSGGRWGLFPGLVRCTLVFL